MRPSRSEYGSVLDLLVVVVKLPEDICVSGVPLLHRDVPRPIEALGRRVAVAGEATRGMLPPPFLGGIVPPPGLSRGRINEADPRGVPDAGDDPSSRLGCCVSRLPGQGDRHRVLR